MIQQVAKHPVQSIAQEEPKHPPKHGSKNFNGMYWNAHCQFWQKQKPFPLGYECEKKYGKGPFVHGYRAPVPYGGTGTGIGYWHQDKQKWLLWEPDPLPKEERRSPSPAGNWVKAKLPDDWKLK